jgi:hypothetical protein
MDVLVILLDCGENNPCDLVAINLVGNYNHIQIHPWVGKPFSGI